MARTPIASWGRQSDRIPRTIYLNSRNLESAGSEEELVELREVPGLPCQSQRERFQDNQVPHKANTKKRHYPHPTNRLVLELRRREGCRRFLLMNVISEMAELILNLPEMVVNTLIVTLSVAL